ncbi:pf2 arrest specific protein 8 11 [Cystoisospora suis]|uniref:Pf2 arrest specific protein 8 11 n=1 Tax=Cystoisospora suis TaxID=483139 RepID=A0A2C6KYE5_9APIC|nr:pf2 arrest specific protein 8 11 [Cystoisospora suis]
MAPKKKTGGASSTGAKPAVEERSPEEQEEEAKRNLMDELKTLQAECESEEKLYSEIVSEKEQLSHLWVLDQNTAEDRHDLLRKKKDEVQDEMESFSMELKLCKLRIKQLLGEQSEEAMQLKIDAEAALKLREDVHREKEQAKWYEGREQVAMAKEMQTAHEQFLQQLKLRQDEKVLELRRQFERSARDLHQKWKLRTENLRDDMQKRRKQLIAKIEEEKNEHVVMVQSQNTKAAQAIKRYYGDITSSNLELIKRLKTMVLEKKIKALQEAEEVATAQVEELQTRRHIKDEDLDSLSKNVPNFLSAKNELAEELRQDITILKQLHDFVVEKYAECLSASGVAVDDLQFVPIKFT